MDKKKKARLEMLRKLSSSKRSEMHEGLGDKLKTKKMQKVEVMAPDKESLVEGLSKAKQILKAKLGDKYSEEDGDESEEELEEECEECEGEGCPVCGEIHE